MSRIVLKRLNADHKFYLGVMGNLGEPSNSQLVRTHKGPWNLGVVTRIVPRGLLAKRGIFAPLSQSTACRVVKSFWYLKAETVNLVRRGPIPGSSLVLGVLGVTCE